MPRLRLEDQISTALERAVAEGRAEVAEHLLQALEALCVGAMAASSRAEADLPLVQGAVPMPASRPMGSSGPAAPAPGQRRGRPPCHLPPATTVGGGFRAHNGRHRKPADRRR